MPSSSPTQWEQISPLLDVLLDLPPDQQQAYLDTACADDPALRREVEAWLALQPDAEKALGDSVTAFVPDLLPGLQAELNAETDPDDNQRIGPYRLIRELGRGGMGTVYLAERDDGQFHKQVALKLIKRGLDTDDILSRFRYERQILASLDHPNIARLYDGGMTDDGRPYFVMEYVEGVPVTAYCDAKRLSTKQRLALFRTVCRAVQYAHQNLIIHRDLKPSNILVAEDGTVKLLDFGIAKLLSEEGLDQTVPRTEAGVRLMTPEYAAPEQVRGDMITTATDVYQLGVLLYELLTGHRPYRMESRVRAEVERVILEEEPTRPSTVIGEPAATQTPETVSQARSTSMDKLQRQLKGDLDTIVLMALKKDVTRRYTSVEHFSDDLRRYLARQPVLAQQDTLGYRVAKFIRRNRVGVGIATGFLFLVIGFSITVLMQQRQTAKERDRAQTEAAKSEQVTDFLVDLFEVNDPNLAQGDTLTAREILRRGAGQIEQELNIQPIIQAKMMTVLGRVYTSLGFYEEAAPLLEQAVEIQRRQATEGGPDLAETIYHQATLQQLQGNYQKAEALFSESLRMRRSLFGSDYIAVAESYHGLAWSLEIQGKTVQAESAYREALRIRRSLLGDQHLDTAETLGRLGMIYRYRDHYDQAEQLVQEALTIRRNLLGESHTAIAENIFHLSIVKHFKGQHAEAVQLQREAVGMYRNLLGADHPTVAMNLLQLASYAHYSDELTMDEAESHLREALQIYRIHFGEEHEWIAVCKEQIGLILQKRGQFEEAEQIFREANPIYMKAYGEENPRSAELYYRLGGVLADQGKHEEAEYFYTLSLAYHRKLKTAHQRMTAGVARALARLLHKTKRPKEAEPFLLEALTIYRSIVPAPEQLMARTLVLLGRVHTALEQYDEAEANLTEAKSLFEKPPTNQEPFKSQILEAFVTLYHAWGKPDEAARYQVLLDAAPASSD